ncbi:IQ domain-containing protein D isoform X2 [Zootermopsis nevadensis]|uniref:IQ domain-containing protein D isoform X2 n=1 Tax=Zootermopsis nevadensis TaxID=136037 RepID=UPI000B8EB516|nr:IQ domain-containing protein D isoform X2 [Zootermopsis nevadensis]
MMKSVIARSKSTLVEQEDNEENSVSHVDLEVAIQAERIANILNHTICKTELVMCLPLLLQNDGELLRPHLMEEEISLVLETCSLYMNESYDHDLELSAPDTTEEWDNNSQKDTAKGENDCNQMSGDNAVFQQSKSPGITVVEGRQNPEMCRVIQLLWNKQAIRNIAMELKTEISPVASIFIKHLKQLKAYTIKCLSTLPINECVRERYLRHLWHHNEQVKAEISIVSAKLEEQNNDTQQKLMAKNLLINQHKAKIERLNKKCNEDMKKIVYDSECKMAMELKNSESRQETLMNEVRNLNIKMKSLLHIYLAQEKELRRKRLKAETQLISWLNKYDTDIGQKQAEYDEALAGFKEKKQQMQELKENFAAQQEVYERLMKEKADEEQTAMEQKIYVFICNRSAQQIQRYWRAYRARKLARRKGRKKRKGGDGSEIKSRRIRW